MINDGNNDYDDDVTERQLLLKLWKFYGKFDLLFRPDKKLKSSIGLLDNLGRLFKWKLTHDVANVHPTEPNANLV